MKKTYRRSISLNGKELKSPRFTRSADADKWYEQKLLERQFLKEGVHLPLDEQMTVSQYFDSKWYPQREKDYPASTYTSDRQRFNDYVRPTIGTARMVRVNQLQVRSCLKAVTEYHGMTVQTRNRVRALLSKFFNDAMNEEPPLRTDNPALNISFNDPRTGKKAPSFIKRDEDIASFMKAARELSSTHYTYAAIALMGGPRKSEAIALTWSDFVEDEAELLISKRFMQAANEIHEGTKKGSEEVRAVQIPDALVKVLKRHKKQSDFQADQDFILCKADGMGFGPRGIYDLHMQIVKASGVKVTPHGLRHTFGREWAKRGGNMKALQAQLGHSNSQTTDLYSQLAGRTVKSHRNTVSIEVDDE